MDKDSQPEQNLLYVKIYEILLHYCTLAIDDMKISSLKKFDTGNRMEKIYDKIENKIASLKSYYVKTVEQELSMFMKKYFSGEKLYNNKVHAMTYILQDLGISLEELKAGYQISTINKDDHIKLFFFILKRFNKKKEEELDEEISCKKKELAEIKNRNDLGYEKFKN
jgi:hypothetical protein